MHYDLKVTGLGLTHSTNEIRTRKMNVSEEHLDLFYLKDTGYSRLRVLNKRLFFVMKSTFQGICKAA